MKTTRKLKKRNFIHLTRQEFDTPLYPLVELCCSETDLHYIREDIHRFIRATTCRNTGFNEDDYGEMFFSYLRFLKHIELLYLLMRRYPDWKASTGSPFYRLEIIGHSYTVYDDDTDEKTLKFWKLSKEEVLDVSLFMRNFFGFRSLSDWRETLNTLMLAMFSKEPFSTYDRQAFQVYEYLEKLGEALFLAYEVRGKEYMLSHCADRFGIKKKKLVDA